MNHGYNNQFKNYNQGYNQQKQDAYQRPRDYDPDLYCGFHKVQGHDDRTFYDYKIFMRILPKN